jgi:hypothetical protein
VLLATGGREHAGDGVPADAREKTHAQPNQAIRYTRTADRPQLTEQNPQ